MKIYSCNYLKVGSDALTVLSVIYDDDVVVVLIATTFCGDILSLHLFHCNLHLLFKINIVIYICTTWILYFIL